MENIKKDQIVYRKAAKDDCPQMVKLINYFAKKGLMLPKNEAKILKVRAKVNEMMAEFPLFAY